MSSHAPRVGRLGRLLQGHTFQLLLLALLFLVLFGALPSARLLWLLLFVVATRAAFLLREALGRRMTADDWERYRAEHTACYASQTPQDLEAKSRELGLGSQALPADLARVAVDSLRSGYVPPRSRSELACEAIGLLTFVLLIPAVVLIYARDFVSLRRFFGWTELGLAALSIALYAWPHSWPRTLRLRRSRMLWWVLPLLPASVLLAAGIALRHPYLDPFREDRAQLAAERVLALDSNVEAEAHADWVFSYAESLEAQDPERAARLYREGLRLAPRSDAARARLARLEGRSGESASAHARPDDAARERARAPLWQDGKSAAPLPRCAIDAGLAALDRTTVVLVPMGDVPESLRDVLGAVIERELGLPACGVETALPLPPHTRTRGLVFGRQWSERSLLQAFQRQAGALPTSPAKLLLLTQQDIYSEGSNFVFSTSYPWGAVVSTKRFEEGTEPGSALWVERSAKQVLGALLKSFGIPPSTDPLCVTSYSNGLPQFDAKGNRPSAESLALFQKLLRERDRSWLEQKARASDAS